MRKEPIKLEMDLKRAINIVSMPIDWFNTTTKKELLNKAIEFIQKNKDMQIIFEGDVGNNISLLAIKARELFLKKIEESLELREANESVEFEGQNHVMDRTILDAYDIISKYQSDRDGKMIKCGEISKKDAESMIEHDFNSANLFSRTIEIDEKTGEYKFTLILEVYERFLRSAIERISNIDEEDRRKMNLSSETQIEDLQKINSYLEMLKKLRKQVRCVKDAEYDARMSVIRKSREYRESMKRVCEELGFPTYILGEVISEKYAEPENFHKARNFRKIKTYLEGLQKIIINHEEKDSFEDTKAMLNYRTSTDKYERPEMETYNGDERY